MADTMRIVNEVPVHEDLDSGQISALIAEHGAERTSDGMASLGYSLVITARLPRFDGAWLFISEMYNADLG